MSCDLCGEPLDYCQGHGQIAMWGAVETVPCDHCDGECTEIVCGEGGYRNGPCSRCQATGVIPASWGETS